MGFNNDGAEAVLRRLASRAHLGGIVGVNVGANKDSPDRVADYVRLIEAFAPVASYFTVNVSSPNTPGLRNLQQAAILDDLLAKVIDARERVREKAGDSPVLLKIAPDLSLAELDDVVHVARSRRVDGMIVANTTIARPSTLARDGPREGAGRAVGPAAVSAVDADGRGNLCARRGRISADRRRRHRFRRRGADQDPRRRQPDPALLLADLQGPRAWSTTSSTTSPRRLLPHRPRVAVGDRRRGCRDDHRRGMAG